VIGWAIVRFVVDSHGNVADAVVRESSQHDFDESCLQAVRRWKFKPGTKSGRAVSFWAEQYFRFTLNGAE
jgi:protein TonB